MRWFLRSLLLVPSIALGWSCAEVPEMPLDPTSDIEPTEPDPPVPGPSREPRRPDGARPIEVTDADALVPSDAATDASRAPTRPTFPSDTPRASPGDVSLSEVMYDPTGAEPASEWIEVHNARAMPRSLAGLTLRDGSGRTHRIEGAPGEIAVAPGGYVVLARDRAAVVASGVPEGAIVHVYGVRPSGAPLSPSEGIQLANGASGAISILDGESEVTSCAYGAYHFVEVDGRSAQVDDAGVWSLASPTPGAAPTR